MFESLRTRPSNTGWKLILAGLLIVCVVFAKVETNRADLVNGSKSGEPQNQSESSKPESRDKIGESQSDRIEWATGELADDVAISLQTKFANNHERPFKVHSNLILALETGHRRIVVLKPLRPSLSDAEIELAYDMLDLQHDRFDRLLEKRVAIMEGPNRELIPELLKYNDIAAFLLARKVSAEIKQEIVAKRKSKQVALRDGVTR